MARSTGEALASGLESGLRLALDYSNARDQKARQAELDRQHLEDRAFNRTRIERADTRQQGLDTLSMGEARLNDIGARVPSANTPEARAGLIREEGAVRGAMSQAQGAIGGPAFAPQPTAKPDVKALLARYQRGPNGEPSEPEAAGMKTMQAFEQGDMPGIVAGYNALHRDSIAKIIGKPSPHGGTILDARLDGLDPDPNSPKEDPRFFGRLKIWVKGDVKGAGDAARAARLQDEGAPEGATGYYYAPITEDRGTGPKSKVKSFSMKEEMDLVGQHLHLAELVNSEEGRAKLAEGGMTPQEWSALQERMAPRMPKATVSQINVPQGAVHYTDTRDPRTGKLISREKLDGNPRLASGANSTEVLYFKLNQIDNEEQAAKDEGTLTPAKQAGFDAERRAVRSGIKPGKYTGETAAGGASGPSLKDREQARKERKDDLASLDKDVDAADHRVDNTRAALSAHLRDKPDLMAAPEATTAWAAERDRLKAKQDKAEAAHQEAIDAKKAGQAEYQRAKAAEESARNPTLGDAKTGSKASSSGGAAPKPPSVGTVKGGYRFKGGNPASQASWEKV